VQTHVVLDEQLDTDEVGRVYDELEARAAAALTTEGFDVTDHRFLRTADLRYFGQAFEVRVPVDELGDAAASFHEEHRALYGYDFSADSTQQVEWVNLRVSGIGPIQRPEIRRHSPSSDANVLSDDRSGSTFTTFDGKRPVCFDAEVGYVDTPVVQRNGLVPGQVVTGPVIVEEFGSTVPVHPGFEVRVDEYLNLIVTRSGS
jgi:N-methylhydantoinase A